MLDHTAYGPQLMVHNLWRTPFESRANENPERFHAAPHSATSKMEKQSTPICWPCDLRVEYCPIH